VNTRSNFQTTNAAKKKRWLLKLSQVEVVADDPNHQRFGGRREGDKRTRTTSPKTIDIEIAERYGRGVVRRATAAHRTTIFICYIIEKRLDMKGSGD
jgi:hypothetical protein